jgi:hypothetical protein
MNKAELFTMSGAFVSSVEIPRFDPMPEVLVWGLRTFTRDPQNDRRYVKAFAYFVP